MTNDEASPTVEVVAASSFKRELKGLKKRYPSIRSDLEPTLKQLEAGQTPGDQISGVKDTVYKVRIPNRDANRGKSGGYPVIYYIRTPIKVLLVAIYSKSERSGISASEVKELIGQANKELDAENLE
ncbi:type II toxin-antitoxin system RelE/ParE family toxin [Leptolyngbya sp. NIES-2104]|uniref:type II toxin-antitoxin system RelE/ParE family toxin n=1 Tax=Leptolyngbya sp. NIES-2104 TaxID=1552121 RepID=UPI00073E9447|nr:type II toxin-antitoxin system RelE/ParE family toxin [Leptolyngbya sp. NIES-2104]